MPQKKTQKTIKHSGTVKRKYSLTMDDNKSKKKVKKERNWAYLAQLENPDCTVCWLERKQWTVQLSPSHKQSSGFSKISSQISGNTAANWLAILLQFSKSWKDPATPNPMCIATQKELQRSRDSAMLRGDSWFCKHWLYPFFL